MPDARRMAVKIMSFETFAAQNGASRQDIGDAGLHRGDVRQSRVARARNIGAQSRKDQALVERRAALRIEFARLVAEGSIVEPTLRERLSAAASGDGERSAAARRVLARLTAITSRSTT